jgi:hypothetical protein
VRDVRTYFFASTVVKEAPVISNDHQNASVLLARRQRARVPRGSQHAQSVEPATKATRTLLTDKGLFGGDHNFQWSGQQVDRVRHDVPGIAAGEVGARARRRQGIGRQPHPKRIQRRSRQVDSSGGKG